MTEEQKLQKIIKNIQSKKLKPKNLNYIIEENKLSVPERVVYIF
jgi:hypothetical protein